MQFEEFLSVLDLLQNPDKYAAKIDELTQREAGIKLSIEHINDRVDVAITHETANQALEDATKVLKEAKEQAQKLLATQQASFDKRLADLQVREIAAEQAMNTYRHSKQQWSQRAEEHRAKEEQLVNTQKQLEADRADLSSKQAEVEVRLTKLRQVMG
jgi:chromosome segregation ATPase